MKDWRFMPHESDWCEMRMKYTQDEYSLFRLFNVPVYYAPEMLIAPEDSQAQDDVWEEAPGMKYAYGYNKDMGDKGIWHKTKYINPPK